MKLMQPQFNIEKLLSHLFIIIVVLNVSLSIPLITLDLTHTLTPTIPYFPSQIRFNFTQQIVKSIDNETPFFYSTNAFLTSEHMGTHIDAPYHFSENSWKLDEIPLENLVSINARIIDVSKQCQNNKNYLITIDDVQREHLTIPRQDNTANGKYLFVLIFYTGWTKYWPDQVKYAGGEINIEFPGLSAELATYLVNTYKDNLVGIGIDTLSIDYGLSKTYPAHQIFAKHNKYGLENVALTDKLIEAARDSFFTLHVYPMKIGNGTGAPCRILAHIGDNRKSQINWFGLLIFFFILFLIGFLVKVVYDFKYNLNKADL